MDDANRRPVAARSWGISQRLARALAKANVTPNQISIASIGFAALAALCLLQLPVNRAGVWWLSYLAILFLLGRGLCNVLDGLVAVEGRKGGKSGELFNDIPDRISDTLYLVAAGYGTTVVSWAPVAGWAAALLAVMTAYVRALGRGVGAGSDFRGPMAKVHRMTTIEIALALTPFESSLWPQGYFLLAALIIIIVGSVVTVVRRAARAYRVLEGK
ncbi:MAG TPA: CDP-alcohol phosphatidyltransferase family protein [Micropepsaceae bacterium]|nr:CDP-alcohol phosphatidyltransferase family protein [Micropepsaceae bacterium]